MSHKPDDQNQNRPQRTWDKIRSLFHRNPPQARMDKVLSTSSSSSQANLNDTTSTSAPSVRTMPSAATTDDPGNAPSSKASASPSKTTPVGATQPESKSIFERYPNATFFLKETLGGLVVAADASNIPGLKAAIAAIQGLIKFAEGVVENGEKVVQLANEATGYANGLSQILDIKQRGGSSTQTDLFNKFVDNFIGELQLATETMNEITAGNTSRFLELWKQGDISAKIKERTGALEEARETFTTLLTVLNSANNEVILETLQELVDAQFNWDTSRLPYLEAAYDQDDTIQTCHSATRAAILEAIYAALSSTSAPRTRIVWLRATAGSGKSTIAKTAAEYLRQKGTLAGSFFFSRNILERSRMKNLFATLANQLATRDKEFAAKLIKVIDADLELRHAEYEKQLKELLIKPLGVFPSSSTTRRPHIFVLDALDECGKDQGDVLVKLILDHIQEFPPSFRFLITSRPEAPLINRFSSPKAALVQTMNIDDDSHEIASYEDIETYLFAELRDGLGLDVLDTEITLLATLANGLFQFAATVVRMLKAPHQIPRRTLDSILKIQRSGRTPASRRVPLDKLYATVFERAYSRDDIEDFALPYDEVVRHHHLAVGGIMCAREPVSITILSALIRLPEDEVRIALGRLSSVLLLPEANDPDTPVRIRHLSFTEYITSPDGDLSRHHRELVIDGRTETDLAAGSLVIMAKDLHFNISQFKSSFQLNNAYPASYFLNVIPRALAYACRFWGSHLECVKPAEGLDLSSVALSSVITFIKEKLLFWLEVTSALGAVNVARAALVSLDKWLVAVDPEEKTRISPTVSLAKVVKDAIKYTEYFAPVIAQSAPHTYTSTIPFTPTSSPVAQLYAPRFPNIASLEIGQLHDWPVTQFIFHGHSQWVNSAAFSPDGKYLVSGSSDKTIRIWDVETGQTTAGPFEGHYRWVNSVAFSPDGKHVVSGSSDKTIRIWDVETGQTTAGPFEGHFGSVYSVAFSPDGKHVVSGSEDKIIRIWDVETGQTTAGPFEGHSDSVTSAAFSPDGKHVVSGSEDKTIRIWDVETGQTTAGPFEGHSDSVNSVAFSPDGKHVVSGSYDKTIRIWDVETGQTTAGPFEGHSKWVNSVAFSPDGKHVVSGSYDNTIRIWDVETGQTTAGPFEGHSKWVLFVAFSPDGKHVVSGSDDKTIRIWDVETGQKTAGPFEGHSKRVNSVAFSPSGKHVVSGSEDKTIRIWDVETGQTTVGPFKGHSDWVTSVAFSPDGKHVVSGSDDCTIRIWDVEEGQTTAGPFEGHSNLVNSVAFSPDGKHVVSGSSDNTIRIWDVETGQTTAGPFEGHSDSVTSVAFSPDGKYLVSGSSDKTIRIWDVETGQTTAGPFEGHSKRVDSVAFSPDGKHVVSGSDDKTIRIWDVETGQKTAGPFEGHSDSVTSVAFSPYGKHVVSGSYDKSIRIWDVETGQTTAGPFEGHSDWVTSVAFSPDGKHVISGSEDNTIRIWDVETGQTTAGPFKGHSDSVNSVAFLPDGKHVLSGSSDQTIQIVDTARSQNWSVFGDQAVLGKDGWVRGPEDELLLWVPPLHRLSFHWPYTVRVFGPHETRVDCSKVVWGETWTGCMTLPSLR